MSINTSREPRQSGNPNTGDRNREASRLGQSRTPEDIPKQDVVAKGKLLKGNVDTNAFVPSSLETGFEYKLAPATRPKISHDNGHLALGRRDPTASDYAAIAKWRAMLSVGEALRPDLTDALAAYRHFLEGGGKPRTFNYERYVMADESGRTTLWNAILDFQDAVQRLYLKQPSLYQFHVTGPAIPCGSGPAAYPYLSSAFPYPATENWQKAIGGHQIWISGDVKAHAAPHASGDVIFEAVMVLHAEDRYNFNVGDVDIATGLPDSDNGRFERIGWGHQYDHFSTLQRYLKWRGFSLGVALSVSPNTTRTRQPTDNRRLRNRL